MREISAVIFQGKPRCGAFFNEETWHMDFFFLPEAVTFEEGHVVAAGRLLTKKRGGKIATPQRVICWSPAMMPLSTKYPVVY